MQSQVKRSALFPPFFNVHNGNLPEPRGAHFECGSDLNRAEPGAAGAVFDYNNKCHI